MTLKPMTRFETAKKSHSDDLQCDLVAKKKLRVAEPSVKRNKISLRPVRVVQPDGLVLSDVR